MNLHEVYPEPVQQLETPPRMSNSLERYFDDMVDCGVANIHEAREYFNEISWAIDKDICVYCGSLATERDHLIPRTAVSRQILRYVPTVPVCVRCNRACRLSACVDIQERSELILMNSCADRSEAELYCLQRGGWLTLHMKDVL